MNHNFTPFPIIESSRLLLREVYEKDLPEILELRGNPENMKYIPRPLITNLDEARIHMTIIQDRIKSNEGINWAITLKGNDKLLGIIGHYRIYPEHFRSEIGYMLLSEFQNQGITTEAIKLVLKYGFTSMNLHSVEAVIDPRNTASEKVLQKNGFIKEAHFIENEFYGGKFIDSVFYCLLKRNFAYDNL